jgi:deazaflavin-dependent oxidoreductase (nitroreductase family)
MTLEGPYVPSKQQWVRDQVSEFEASDGARANTLRDTGDPIVVITSVGARTGHLRKNPVMRVERDGAYVAIASQGGAPDHPQWYHNFLAHPLVELQDGSEKHLYAARLVQGPERDEWWKVAVETWPTYARYQEKTDREIPVFVLERLERAA